MTPMQELIEVLNIHRDTAFEKEKRYPNNKEYYEGRAKAFEDAISFAETHLEKEKEVMYDTWLSGISNCDNDTLFDEYYNETFNNK